MIITLVGAGAATIQSVPAIFKGDPGDGGSGGTVTWNNVTGKPTSFTPSTHTHSIAQVTGLQTALDGKLVPTGFRVVGNMLYLDLSNGTALSTTLPVSSEPLPEIDAVVFIGASHEFAMFGKNLTTPNSEATSMLLAKGYDLPVYGWATSGARIADADIHYQAAREAFPNALIISQFGGNDVSDSRPYPGGNTLINQGLSDLLNLAQNDANFYPASLTFRDYDDTTFQNPNNGSKPYNENIFIPWINTNFPHAMAPYGRPKIDLYRFVLDNYENLLSADNVHFTTSGYAALKQFYIDRVADVLGDIVPTEIVERVYVAPPAGSGLLSIINFHNGPSTAVAGTNNLNGTSSSVEMSRANIVDTSGVNTGMSLVITSDGTSGSTTDPGFGGGNTGRTNLPAYNGQLAAGPITAGFYYVTATPTMTLTVSGAVPNATYEVGMIGSRNATAARQTTFTVQGVATTWDAAEAIPQERKVTVQANAQGQIVMTLKATGGSTFAYISGISLQRLS